MKKIILVDGNNLMFRSYYATAYSGSIMRNSKDFPTNALYGFVSMINKIIDEEKPEYMAVAFDIGKNFRKDKYQDYKAGRHETPQDLKLQMPVAREILDKMGIKHFELEPYEADDIIGTLAKMADNDPDFDATVVSSDRDLLQLISDVVDVKLLKQKGHIRYNPQTFYEDYKIAPINIIDLKALAGDSSDNIPGVKGVGEKTALTLLQKYTTLENIYDHIDEIKGKLQEKLINDKDNAFFSKEIATIYRDVPLNIKDLEDITYEKNFNKDLYDLFVELEFYSFIKNSEKDKNTSSSVEFTKLDNLENLVLEDKISLYIECDDVNYHTANIISVAVSDSQNNYLINPEQIKKLFQIIDGKEIYTYDLKKNIVLLKKYNINIANCQFDTMIASSLLYDNLKEDIAYYMNNKNVDVPFYENLKKGNFSIDVLEKTTPLKARFIYDTHDELINELENNQMLDLFIKTEMPLSKVLAKMELEGVKVNLDVLLAMKKEVQEKIDIISDEIYEMAGKTFNISSPKQLGEVLFDDLGLPFGKRNVKGYKTDIKVLHKLMDYHPIINKIMEYRNLTKLMNTYIDGLPNFILEDGKIHTIYTQTLTRTGRLSSILPNLQNIPTRDQEGKKIRKAFIPVNDLFLSADYSQIELRLLAHISGSKELQDAFINGQDIHKKVAADIFGVEEKDVSKEMRSTAKAVIFGIVYGISGFGLGENLSINAKEAKTFIDKYLELYPGVKKYMDNIVKEAYEKGYVKTLFDRKRNIDELKSKVYQVRSAGERIALNTPIQGTSADIIKMAMVKIDREFTKLNIKSKMILQVHDELIFDIKLAEKEQVESIVKDIMENIVSLSVPLKASADYGTDWYETK